MMYVGLGREYGGMRAKITKSTVDAARPSVNTLKIYDTEVRGFLLVVTPAGSKSYAIEYRAGTGRGSPMRRMVIGKHGVLTPDQARRLAREKLAEVARGGDPAKERKARREAQTFGELIDLYFAKGALKRDGTPKKPSTVLSDRGRAEQHLRPLLGDMAADQVRPEDVIKLRDIVAGDRRAPRSKRGRGSVLKGGQGAAAQCVALVSSIYSWVIRRGLVTENPARGVEKARVNRRERYLSEAEIARLADALDAEAIETGNPYPVAAIKLLLFTGCRKGEIVGLGWQDVDFERACLRLPDSKTGAKAVHLNAPALALLEAVPRLEDNPHVIPGVRSGAGAGPAIDKAWARVRRAAGLSDVRLHDLRHSYASVAVAGGASLPIIGALLGHKHTVTTARYAHLSDDPLRAVNEMVGERIAAAMAGRGGSVVPLRRRS
jgi:integrase